MIRLVIYIILLTVISVFAWILIENDGVIEISWLDYQVQASFIFCFLALIIFILLLSIFVNFLNWLKDIPDRVSDAYSERKNKKGMLALIDGFGALSAGDIARAKKDNKKLISTMGSEELAVIQPITNLFQAQLASADGDDGLAEKNYSQMLEFDKTKIVGLKGLIHLRIKNNRYKEALEYAEQAHEIASKSDWLLSILIDLYKRDKDWDMAIKTVKRARKYDYVDEEYANKEYANIYNKTADEYSKNGESGNVIKYMEKALNYDPCNIDYALRLAGLLKNHDSQKAALKVLYKTWKHNPNKRLSDYLLELCRNEKNTKILEKLEEFKRVAPNNYLSFVIIAEFLIHENMLSKAREIMDEILKKGKNNPDISKVMVLLETKSSSKSSVILKWVNNI